jgi:hypothetical protein
MKCTFCEKKKAEFQDNIWGVYYWCIDCDEEAAWAILDDVSEEVNK